MKISRAWSFVPKMCVISSALKGQDSKSKYPDATGSVVYEPVVAAAESVVKVVENARPNIALNMRVFIVSVLLVKVPFGQWSKRLRVSNEVFRFTMLFPHHLIRMLCP